jgi:4-amino-4-deoxy-L-arabinose transferase-like glycosyltransferase
MYAAIAAASLPAGKVSESSARLPSALAATATVLLMSLYFARQLGPPAGMVAGIILPLSLLWMDKATAAEIDMLQTAWVAAAILCLLRALEATELNPCLSLAPCPSPLAPSLWWTGSLLCVSAGVLTKWTAPIFFYGTAVPLLWWRGRLRLLWGRPHVVAALLGIGICLTWATAVAGHVGWNVFWDAVGRELFGHLSGGHHHQSYPWRQALAHPLWLWAAGLPASAFALPALWPGFARRWDARGRLLLAALHCWTWPNMVFWSLLPGHGSRQAFPLFPGLAGLAAMVWVGWLTGRSPWRLQVVSPGKALLWLIGLWLVAKLIFVHVIVHGRDNRQPRAKGEQIARAVPEGQTLYLFRLKDEGLMFYYGRPVRRLQGLEQLPSSGEPLYCILDESEWRREEAVGGAEVVLRLTDEQGAPIVLVRKSGIRLKALRVHERSSTAQWREGPERRRADPRRQDAPGGGAPICLGSGRDLECGAAAVGSRVSDSEG